MKHLMFQRIKVCSENRFIWGVKGEKRVYSFDSLPLSSMSLWNSEKGKRKIGECLVISFVIILIIWGVLCECLVRRGIVFFYVVNLDGMALALLQIQASIITLTIAVISLLSGSLSDSYLGVSICSFHMEIRPVVLKFHVIILSELMAIVFGIVAYILSMFNVAVSLCISAIIIITVPIKELYCVFRGRRNTIVEIEEYVRVGFLVEKDYMEFGKRFLEDWKAFASKMSEEEFDKHFDIFMILIDRMLKKEGDINSVNSFAEKVASFLLDDDNKTVQKRGLRFVIRYYEFFKKWISENRKDIAGIQGQVHLIDRVCLSWYRTVDLLEAEIIERIIDFKRLTDNVILVAYSMGNNTDGNSEVESVYALSKELGYYISRQYKKGNIVDSERWEVYADWRFGNQFAMLAEVNPNLILFSCSERDFYICQGYLLNGQIEFVKNGFFLDGVAGVNRINHETIAFRVMIIHCYMYYLAYREDASCIDPGLQERIKRLIEEKSIVDSVSKFFHRLRDSKHYLNEALEERMEQFLRKNELFPQHSLVKGMVLEHVVQEYFLFVFLLVEKNTGNSSCLERIDINKYISYLRSENRNMIRAHFAELYRIIVSSSGDENYILNTVDEMVTSFEALMRENYKKEVVNQAKKKQLDFDNNPSFEENKENIRKHVTEEFNKLFDRCSVPTKIVKQYKNELAFRIVTETDMVFAEDMQEYYDYALGAIFERCIKKIEKMYIKNRIERIKGFDSAKAFQKYADEKGFDYFWGTYDMFHFGDIDENEIEQEYFNKKKLTLVPASTSGLMIKRNSTYLRLDALHIEFETVTSEEMGLQKDKNGVITYCPQGGIPLYFDKDEFDEFIRNEKKVVCFYVDVSVGIDNARKKGCSIIVNN